MNFEREGITHEDVEEEENEEGEEGGEWRMGMEQERAPGDENDGVVGEGNDGGEQEDHEVAENAEARAQLKQVYVIHSHSSNDDVWE